MRTRVNQIDFGARWYSRQKHKDENGVLAIAKSFCHLDNLQLNKDFKPENNREQDPQYH